MSNITVEVPPALSRVIDRVRVRKKSKHKALRHLMELALSDSGEFVLPNHYGDEDQDSVSCTLDVKDDELDRALYYRERYSLVTRIAFLRYALVHGATLFEAELLAAVQPPQKTE